MKDEMKEEIEIEIIFFLFLKLCLLRTQLNQLQVPTS